jgi:Protein of unknwon function (DUF3310)
MNKAEKIKKMLRAGATVKDIVKKLKVSQSYVYLVKKETGEEPVVVHLADAYQEPFNEPEMPIAPLPETLDPLKVQVGGNHYKDMPIQPVEFIHANGIPYIEGAVIKYVCRWRNKNGINDLQKAAHFLELLMQLEKNKEGA